MNEAAIRSEKYSQSGWCLRTEQVELFITENGGHMAPVRFDLDGGTALEPYYISPWQDEGLKSFPDPVLAPLRGDFFCMPFGANAEEVDGEKHSVHGEAASARWHFVELTEEKDRTTLTLELRTTVRPGKITKKIHLRPGQNVVYTEHHLEGYSGSMPIGHHCNLDVPEEEGSLRIALSEYEIGRTPPVLVSNPANREYQSLAVGAEFTDLTRVPVLWKDHPPADCTSFPQRIGFTDLLQVCRKPGDFPAWTVAYCPSRQYLWFSLKDAARLPGTVIWISNKGRHGPPWNGRNRCLGLEETCSYFADGLGPSLRPNEINAAGFPTALELSPSRPTVIPFIQGAVRISPAFTCLESVHFEEQGLRFVSTDQEEVRAKVHWDFLFN